MANASFYTLGCRLNFADTGSVQSDFEHRGYSIVPFGQRADVTVINTCSVTEEANRKCRKVIRRARRANPDAFIIVTGCYAQLEPGQIAGIEGVDAVVGTGEKFRIFDVLSSLKRSEQTQVAVACIDSVRDFAPAESHSSRVRAFLKVQDGCDYSCAFCTIPAARGKSRSNPMDAVVARADQLAADGIPEVVLTGVNVGLYDDRGHALLSLLKRLDAETAVPRFRISSIEPNLLTNDIVDFVASSRAFVPHFHVPLQSGDDHVLGNMRRRYRSRAYRDRVEYIRSQMPDACVGCDVIVGHPGETAERFDNTVQFINSLPVAYLHVFTYSERPGTPAAERMGTDVEIVDVAERRRRCRQLRVLSEKKRTAFYRSQIGKLTTVVWEHPTTDDARSVLGYTENFVRLRRGRDEAVIGKLDQIRISSEDLASR